jgi:hypothetical protein
MSHAAQVSSSASAANVENQPPRMASQQRMNRRMGFFYGMKGTNAQGRD